MADHYVMVFHHADGHLIGEEAIALVKSHYTPCWLQLEPTKRPEYILRRVIGDRTTFLFNESYKLVQLTLGEAVNRIMDMYREMESISEVAAPATRLNQGSGTNKRSLKSPEETRQEGSSSEEDASQLRRSEAIRINHSRALKRLKALIEKKERLEMQREVYELAISRGRRYLAWCRELANREVAPETATIEEEAVEDDTNHSMPQGENESVKTPPPPVLNCEMTENEEENKGATPAE